MIRLIILIIITLATINCGTTGGLELPFGVEDRSKYAYPPELNVEECEEENSEDCIIVE
tara:strand:+ start:186 stop:362 length:177 start_codon:yes stop_codon:yes gene_type:complete